MNWRWQDEVEPPAPEGVVGTGAVARRLLEAVAVRVPRERARLSATAHDGLLVLVGPADQLPWVDGVQFVAPRVEVAALWLPTTRRPTVPLDLLAQAVARLHRASPLLMLPEPAQLVSLARLLPADDFLIAQIRARWEAATA
jgi:hypothetical protein